MSVLKVVAIMDNLTVSFENALQNMISGFQHCQEYQVGFYTVHADMGKSS